MFVIIVAIAVVVVVGRHVGAGNGRVYHFRNLVVLASTASNTLMRLSINGCLHSCRLYILWSKDFYMLLMHIYTYVHIMSSYLLTLSAKEQYYI